MRKAEIPLVLKALIAAIDGVINADERVLRLAV
jgi:hypothetical protein